MSTHASSPASRPEARPLKEVTNVSQEPKKLSIRVLDNADFMATREEDLDHGILIRQLGLSLTADGSYPPLLDSDLYMPDLGNAAECSLFLNTPLSMEYVGSEISSKSSNSSRSSLKDTYSVYSGSVASSQLIRSHYSGVQASTHIQKLPGPAPEPRASEPVPKRLPERPLTQRAPEIALKRYQVLSDPVMNRPCEFSWDSGGQLMFGGQPFEVGQNSKYSFRDDTTDSLGRMYSLLNEPCDMHMRYEARVSAPYTNLNMSSGRAARVSPGPFHRLLIGEYLSEFGECIGSFFDDRFWRTHGPQRSDNKGSSSQIGRNHTQSPTAPYSTHSLTKSLSFPRPITRRSRRGRANGDDSSDDSRGGEDPGGNDSRRLSASGRKKASRPVDCPYHKRDPVQFRDCTGAGFRKISHLKQHLNAKHTVAHCKVCFMVLNPDRLRRHVCHVSEPSEGLFMTDDIATRVNQRADGKKTLEEQWLHIYEVLFPNDKPPFPCPYVQRQAVEVAEHLKEFLRENRLDAWHEVTQNLSTGCPVPLNRLEKEFDRGIQEWLSRTITLWLANSQDHPSMIGISGVDNSQPANNQERIPPPDDTSQLGGPLVPAAIESAPMFQVPELDSYEDAGGEPATADEAFDIGQSFECLTRNPEVSEAWGVGNASFYMRENTDELPMALPGESDFQIQQTNPDASAPPQHPPGFFHTGTAADISDYTVPSFLNPESTPYNSYQNHLNPSSSFTGLDDSEYVHRTSALAGSWTLEGQI